MPARSSGPYIGLSGWLEIVRSFAPGSFLPVSNCARQTAFAAVSDWPAGDLPSTVFATNLLPLEWVGCAYPFAGTNFASKRGLACGCREGNAGPAPTATI